MPHKGTAGEGNARKTAHIILRNHVSTTGVADARRPRKQTRTLLLHHCNARSGLGHLMSGKPIDQPNLHPTDERSSLPKSSSLAMSPISLTFVSKFITCSSNGR